MTRSVFLVLCLLIFNVFDVCSSQSTGIFISFMNDSISVEEGVGTVQVRLIAYGKYETLFTVGVTCFEKLPVEAKVGTVNNGTVDVYPKSYTVEFNDVGKKSWMSTPLTINIVDDPLVETRESFVCIAFQPRDVSGVQLRNPRTLEITIVDNDMTVQFNTSVLTVDEASNIDIQLVAQGRFGKSFTVNLTFTDGTAKYRMDYFYPPLITPSVTFTPGSMSSSVFRVTPIPNNNWEGTKWFEVGFVLPSGQNLNSGRPDTLRVNIADDDYVDISFERSTQTVREDSGSVKLRLQSSGLYGRRFSVSFTCIQASTVEAKDGEDFTGGVYTVEFQTLGVSSSVSSTAVIPIVDDSISEGKESFICVIMRPRGVDGIIAKDPSAITIVIEDDDFVKVSFEKAEYSGEEGKFISEIRLKATPFKRPFSARIFATTLNASRPEKDCEATSGVDYTDPQTLPGRGVVQFSPALGPTSSTLIIRLLSDNIIECTEYFGLKFVAISGVDELAVILEEPKMAIVAINDTNGSGK